MAKVVFMMRLLADGAYPLHLAGIVERRNRHGGHSAAALVGSGYVAAWAKRRAIRRGTGWRRSERSEARRGPAGVPNQRPWCAAECSRVAKRFEWPDPRAKT